MKGRRLLMMVSYTFVKAYHCSKHKHVLDRSQPENACAKLISLCPRDD
jgi:hypothetical protein